MTERVSGKVKFYSETKGWGFLSRPGGEDVFVHKTNLVGVQSLITDQQVTFIIMSGRDGRPAAAEVKVA